jgi:protein-S-isoprenylcysteine O-methyltransferase Ste14
MLSQILPQPKRHYNKVMLKWITLIAGTIILAYISRASLRVPRSHGFYRFIAWELMLALVVLDIDGWYGDTLTPDQVVCNILMNISLLLVIVGYLSLFLFGQHDAKRSDAPLLLIEKTTVLVTNGIYRYIRHPIYSSLIFLDFGLFFKRISWLSGLIALIACAFLVLTALAEENENIRYFGVHYKKYMKRTKLFVPFMV